MAVLKGVFAVDALAPGGVVGWPGERTPSAIPRVDRVVVRDRARPSFNPRANLGVSKIRFYSGRLRNASARM